MRKIATYLAVIGWLVSGSVAHACKPVYHANPARDFIREAGNNLAPAHVIFTGQVVSISGYRDRDGNYVRDTAVRSEHWWLGDGRGVVLVRTITPPAFPPCGPAPTLEAKEGERWLIFGWWRDGRIEPYTDPRVSMPLPGERMPAGMAQELKRIGHPVNGR